MSDQTSAGSPGPREASDRGRSGPVLPPGGEQGATGRLSRPGPAADLFVDGTGLLCVTLLLRLRRQIDGARPGTVVHVLATDPAAPLDLPAWCHMTGHAYLGPVPGERPVYALRLAADARPTREDAPWHPERPGERPRDE